VTVQTRKEGHGEGNPERIPWQQRLYDSPFLLLALGLGTMLVFYTLWGLVEILRMPTAPLP
jgi:hypothetical protein